MGPVLAVLMFFVVLLALCAASFLLGYLSRKTMLVRAIAIVGIVLVAYQLVSVHAENPGLVAVVQLVCVGLIVASCASGVRLRELTPADRSWHDPVPVKRRPFASSGSGVRVLSRGAAVGLLVLAAAMGALVVLGMATGTNQQFEKGVTPLWFVIVIQAGGLLCLIALAGLVIHALHALDGRASRVLRWAGWAIPIWLFWAFLRIGEYAS